MVLIKANDKALSAFKELILLTCGFSLEMGREQTLVDGLRERMALRGIERLEAYHALLVRDRDELDTLVELLTVNETYFFREPEHLHLMVDKLLPTLLAERNNRPVTILSAGCSTGEEPYSIAIMLHERYGAESGQMFRIMGVDIDSRVIAEAGRGMYGKSSFRGMDERTLARYFEPAGRERFQVREEIRSRTGFEVVNLLAPGYPEGMRQADVILYRNVSIYFPQPVQQEIFGRLAGILTLGGYLLVGAAETIHHDLGILSLEQQDALFYYRKKPALVFGERRTGSRSSPIPDRFRDREAKRPGLPEGWKETGRMPREARVGGAEPAPSPRGAQQGVSELFDRAVELARTNQPDRALGVLDAVIGREGAFVKAHTLKASLLLNASRFDETARACRSALSHDPLCLEAYLILGMTARHQGEYDEALKRLREAIYLNPSCWPAQFYTAEILLAQGDEKRARSSYETVIRLLEKGPAGEREQAFFPLLFNTDQFMLICRHKLSLLKKG